MSKRINIRESIVNMLEDTIKDNDYMSLVSVQLKIKTGFYENWDMEAAKKDITALQNYKKSYPHISSQVDEVIEYLNGISIANELNEQKG